MIRFAQQTGDNWLRKIVTIMKASAWLERMGDHAVQLRKINYPS